MKILSRLKWLMWAFRAYTLVKSLGNLIKFVNLTHVVMKEIRAELDTLCKDAHSDNLP